MASSEGDPTVLVVDDEESVADSFAMLLDRQYEVRTAYGGEQALELLDDHVDVVLLDRRMPDLSGDEVLDRARGRGYDGQVIMVTAVTPDVDVIDLAVDDYLVKPLAGDSVFDSIDEQLVVAEADDTVAELSAVSAKLSILEEYATSRELRDHPAYGELQDRAAELRARVDEGEWPVGEAA